MHVPAAAFLSLILSFEFGSSLSLNASFLGLWLRVYTTDRSKLRLVVNCNTDQTEIPYQRRLLTLKLLLLYVRAHQEIEQLLRTNKTC
jgi:hypothetical protein